MSADHDPWCPIVTNAPNVTAFCECDLIARVVERERQPRTLTADINAQAFEERLITIAKVIAWTEGVDLHEISDLVARSPRYMQWAQECAEDLGWAHA